MTAKKTASVTTTAPKSAARSASAAATKAPAKKVPAKKASAKKAATTEKTATTKSSPPKKAPATKAPATKAATTKARATKAATTKKAPAARQAAAAATEPPAESVDITQASAGGPVPTTSSTAPSGAEPSGTAADPETLRVRPEENPWTEAELAEVRGELEDEINRLREQIENSNAELVGLLRDGSDGAGRDPADVGSTNFERDHEISLANNAREALEQSELALHHIAAGTYGICDHCGQPIGKGRLQAFPRATLCVSCKQRAERR